MNKLQQGDVYIMCVTTPFHTGSDIPKPNIDYVLSATKSIAQYIKPGDLIILESTSPVGTTEKVQKTLINCGANLEDVHIAYCPERVRPGKIMTELVENERIVGGLSAVATKKDMEYHLIEKEALLFHAQGKPGKL